MRNSSIGRGGGARGRGRYHPANRPPPDSSFNYRGYFEADDPGEYGNYRSQTFGDYYGGSSNDVGYHHQYLHYDHGYGQPPGGSYGHPNYYQDQNFGGPTYFDPNYHNYQQQSFLEQPVSNYRSRNRPGHSNRGGSSSADQNLDNLDNLRDRLHVQLENESYECPICFTKIRRVNWTWSCSKCFQVFHLNRDAEKNCILKWARQSRDENGSWPCPTCKNQNDSLPIRYLCFCGKRANPQAPNVGAECPHSCGDICEKPVHDGRCPHPCTLPCHPGPCPPCPRTVSKRCLCGKKEMRVRCGSDDIRCSLPCDKLLNCEFHKCQQKCHSGSCSPCEEVVSQTCFCTRETRKVACTKTSLSEDGYSCGAPCKNTYDCGIHNCTRVCHPQGQCGPCPWDTNIVTHCPCGKVKLPKIEGATPRKSCQDPVPTCGKICDKVLMCGPEGNRHHCQAICHTGNCPPCELNSTIRCRCKGTTKTIPCQEFVKYGDTNPYLCTRKCKKTKSCHQHKCGQPCCVDFEHICMQICGKKLDCKLHECDQICHLGKCRPCLNAGFTELACHCGQTYLEPPIPCGARPPECTNLCTREHSCDHPVTHTCHSDPMCPPCTHLTQKFCMGEHKICPNIPCYLTDISCGMQCQKPLRCGVHYCIKSCHRGNCEEESEECTQPCTVDRPECGHICGAKCHGRNKSCPLDKLCEEKVNVSCKCGRRKSTMPCHQVDSIWNKILASAQIQNGNQMFGQDLLRLTSLEENEAKIKCLPCDSECERILRNQMLAEALGVMHADVEGTHGHGRVSYTEYLKGQAKTNPTLVRNSEQAMINLMEKMKSTGVTQRSYSFNPMSTMHRRLIHEYAEYFGFETMSVDAEPNRSVVVTAKRGKSSIPSPLLSSFCPTEQRTANRVISNSSSFTDFAASSNKWEAEVNPNSQSPKIRPKIESWKENGVWDCDDNEEDKKNLVSIGDNEDSGMQPLSSPGPFRRRTPLT